MRYYELLITTSILLYIFAPVAIIIFTYSVIGKKYHFQYLGTIIGFSPFILMAIALYLDFEKHPNKAFIDLDVFEYAVVSVSFFVCLFTVLILNGDTYEGDRPRIMYGFWLAIILIMWFLLHVASTIFLVLASHNGQLM